MGIENNTFQAHLSQGLVRAEGLLREPGTLSQYDGSASYPVDRDVLVLGDGKKPEYLLTSKEIEFRGLRFGDKVSLDGREFSIMSERDRAVTLKEKAQKGLKNLSELPEWLAFQWLPLKARLQSSAIGIFGGK